MAAARRPSPRIASSRSSPRYSTTTPTTFHSRMTTGHERPATTIVAAMSSG